MNTSTLNYLDVALDVLSKSIKSAVFIDDKAREFYSIPNEKIKEEELCVNLFKNFKSKNISLAIHKFKIGDEKNEELRNYLFSDRDLVLLDWKLDDQDGESYSLKLLANVVKSKHLHFCIIYTTESNKNNIYSNIFTYFSDRNTDYYDQVKADLDEIKDDLKPYLDKLNPFILGSNGKLVGEIIKENKKLLDKVKEVTEINDSICALFKAKWALSSFHKSEEALSCPDQVIQESDSIIINNTIIIILNKDLDNDPDILLKRISEQINKSPFSFIQLLGFEMQSLFRSHSSFIDEQILSVSKDALMHHRNYVKEKDGNDKTFKLFIKNLLIEHATLGLRTSRLKLLEDNVLDILFEKKEPNIDEMFKMNVFYNSRTVYSLESDKEPLINFGDLFKGNNGNYYLCITALCDCFRPSKIDRKYYFVRGQGIDKELAIGLGDTAFVSYLPDGNVVSWVSPESDDDTDKSDYYKFKPVYIKPHQFHIQSEYIKDKKIIKVAIESNGEEFKTTNEDLIYITTIRNNYTQRIANHAFSHPIRVGVDFVKK